jgi:hypothetical protein
VSLDRTIRTGLSRGDKCVDSRTFVHSTRPVNMANAAAEGRPRPGAA